MHSKSNIFRVTCYKKVGIIIIKTIVSLNCKLFYHIMLEREGWVLYAYGEVHAETSSTM